MPATLSVIDRVNYLNILLMVISAALAYLIPFELFLAAYAVLGPLHYLTQISWLHDRKYFSYGRFDVAFLVVLSLLATFPVFFHFETLAYSYDVVLVAFLAAFAMAFIKNPRYRWIWFAATIPVAGYLTTSGGWIAYFIFFLPTLIHVFFFTWCFVLYGTLKDRSFSGLLSLVVFTVLAMSYFWVTPSGSAPVLSQYVSSSLAEFGNLEVIFARVLGWDPKSGQLASAMGFIAFAYTYHYLNWFSKTQVIRWHRVGRPRLVAIGIAYLTSLALYAYDYRVGLVALGLLSLAHVLLEFPLNMRTFQAIATGVRR